jgi:hypothetical protein
MAACSYFRHCGVTHAALGIEVAGQLNGCSNPSDEIAR